MTGRELRPGAQQNVRAASGEDEISRRESMEAFENTALPRRAGGGPPLHRVDPDRVARTMSSSGHHDGYARLDLMVNTIFDRLVAGERDGLAGS